MKTNIKELALAHAEAAIQVLADIMNDAKAPAPARISAAKAILDRGLGKPATEKPKPESREAPVVRIERVIIDPKEPHADWHRLYTHAPKDISDEEEEDLDQQDLTRVQRAPPDVGEFSDYRTANYNEWGNLKIPSAVFPSPLEGEDAKSCT